MKIGDVLDGTYEVVSLLGEGGMGRVYLVRHERWRRLVAMKSPKLEALGLDGLDAFVAEAKTWVALPVHPHVATCHYVRSVGGVPRVFAEYLEGGSVADAIASGTLYDEPHRVFSVALGMARGLAHAHAQRLVHQDVKPANVLLTKTWRAKITDFGLARALRAPIATSTEPSATAMGLTRAYASPEQLVGERLTPASDVFSWAVSVLHMLVGDVTWPLGVAAEHALDQYLRSRTPRVPIDDALAERVRACLSLQPSRRPTFEAIASWLEDLLAARDAPMSARHAPPAATVADDRNNRGVSYVDLGEIELADEAFNAVGDAEHVEAVYNRALLRWRRGVVEDDGVLRALDRLDDERTRRARAWIHLERGDHELALEHVRHAIDDVELTRAMSTARPVTCERVVSGNIESLAATPDLRRVIAVVDGALAWVEVSIGELVSIRTPLPRVDRVALHPDGSILVATGDTLHWLAADGRPLRSTAITPGIPIGAIGVAPDGAILLGAARRPGTDDHVPRSGLWRIARDGTVHYETTVGRLAAFVPYEGRLLALERTKHYHDTLPAFEIAELVEATTREPIPNVAPSREFYFFKRAQPWNWPDAEAVAFLGGGTRAISTGRRTLVHRRRFAATDRDPSFAVLRSLPCEGEHVVSDARGDRALVGGADGLFLVHAPATVTAPWLLSQLRDEDDDVRFERLVADARRALDEERRDEAVAILRRAREVRGHERDAAAVTLWSRATSAMNRVALRGLQCIHDETRQTQAIGIRALAPRFVSITDRQVAMWDVGAEKPELLAIPGEPARATMALDGRTVAWTTKDGSAEDLHLAELDGVMLRAVWTRRLPAPTNPYADAPLAISPCGTFVAVASAGSRVFAYSASGEIVADVELPPNAKGHPSRRGASELVIDDRGSAIVAVNSVQEAHVIDAARGLVVSTRELPYLDERIYDDVIHHVYGSEWLRRHLPGAGASGVGATTTDGRHGVRASDDARSIEIVDARTGEVLRASGVPSFAFPRVSRVALSTDGRIAAVSERNIWSMWQLDWDVT